MWKERIFINKALFIGKDMKVLIKNNLVDLEAPVCVTEEQEEKIVSFFKKNFPDVSSREVSEPEREYGEREQKQMHKWTAKDYLMLFSDDSNEEISSKIGLGTEMGSRMKRGEFVMKFLKWKKQKKEGSLISEKLIQEFLDEVSS